jgi:Fe-S-cluster containining protein
MPGKDLERADRRLLQVVDEAMAEAAARAGDRLACGPGCTECCHGPFPINALDARRLRAGLALLADREPERAAAVVVRAQRLLPLLRRAFPGNPATGILEDSGLEEDTDADEYFSRHAEVPCPALDPATGRCELYAWRPLSCRTFGPPVRIGEADLPPCRLCFVDATDEEIEACRVEPDPHGLEDRMVDRFHASAETLIAFALSLRD